MSKVQAVVKPVRRDLNNDGARSSLRTLPTPSTHTEALAAIDRSFILFLIQTHRAHVSCCS